MEKIIANLSKAKLKLDEAFFYLDEIEELIHEDDLNEEAGARITQAADRLTAELSALGGKVSELESILVVLESQEVVEGPAGAAGAADEG